MTVSSKANSEKTILVLHGPNLNLLGTREPEVYGSVTLAEIDEMLAGHATTKGFSVYSSQSNHEGALIDMVQEGAMSSEGLVINPAGYTHTSVALADAIKAYPHPVIEVHLSNIYAREAFRHHSYISPYAQGVICGLGVLGYRVALDALIELL